jgi:hypothetical protein
MALKVLRGELYLPQATTILAGMWMRVDEHQRLDAFEARIKKLEKQVVKG